MGRQVQMRVIGVPAPQGSKKLINGRMIESSAAVAPWRQAVVYIAAEKMDGQAPLDGPLDVIVVFHMPRPKSLPKKRLWPDRKPDVDKLQRSTFDALTDACVWHDDGQVVEVLARKQYADVGQPTGALIFVSEVTV